MTGLAIDVDQNTYLPAGVGRVDAVITVEAPDSPVAAPPTDGLEIIILDCSTSMSGDRISAARQAAAEAIAQVRDGVAFVVIAGTATAEQVYPATGTATADGRTRAEATAKVQRLRANGATAIGTWLTLAGQLADRHGERHPGAVRHAILLTDGQNGERVAVFPQYCPARTFALLGSQMTIGRRSRSRGVEPEIDLSGPSLDPGVSTLHAVLLATPTGGWDLVDVGSRNGTVINDDPDPIVPNAPVHLAVGDRIKLGAWTVLTVGGKPQSR